MSVFQLDVVLENTPCMCCLVEFLLPNTHLSHVKVRFFVLFFQRHALLVPLQITLGCLNETVHGNDLDGHVCASPSLKTCSACSRLFNCQSYGMPVREGRMFCFGITAGCVCLWVCGVGKRGGG